MFLELFRVQNPALSISLKYLNDNRIPFREWNKIILVYKVLAIGRILILSATNWHLPRALPMTEQQRHLPSASMELEKIGVHPAMHKSQSIVLLGLCCYKKNTMLSVLYITEICFLTMLEAWESKKEVLLSWCLVRAHFLICKWLSSFVRTWQRGKRTLWSLFSCMLQAKSLNCVQLFATLWTVAHRAPLSMGFSR